MVDSFLKSIDEGLRALIFTTFGDNMGFSSVESDDVILFPKDVAQRVISEKRDVNRIEFANLWRERTSISWGRQRTPLARGGLYGSYVDGASPSSGISGEKIALTNIKAVPADLDYNVWFWSHDLDKLNKVSETYMFWKQDNPNLEIYYNSIYPLEFDIRFPVGEIVDESNLPNMFEIGKIFVIRIPIHVDGWVFQSSEQKTIKRIIVTLYDEDDIGDVEDWLEEATSEEKENLELYQEIVDADE